MHQATRRLDVDVKWLREVGVTAAKMPSPSTNCTSSKTNPKAKINRLRESGGGSGQKLLG